MLVRCGAPPASGGEAAGGYRTPPHRVRPRIRIAQGRHAVDAGDRFQADDTLRRRRQSLVYVAVELAPAAGERVVFVQQVGEQDAIRFGDYIPCQPGFRSHTLNFAIAFPAPIA